MTKCWQLRIFDNVKRIRGGLSLSLIGSVKLFNYYFGLYIYLTIHKSYIYKVRSHASLSRTKKFCREDCGIQVKLMKINNKFSRQQLFFVSEHGS